MCKFKHKELVHYLLLSTPLHILNICKRFRGVAYHCVGTTLGKQLHKPHGGVLALCIYVKTQYILLVLRADDYLVGVADEIHTRCVLVNAVGFLSPAHLEWHFLVGKHPVGYDNMIVLILYVGVKLVSLLLKIGIGFEYAALFRVRPP